MCNILLQTTLHAENIIYSGDNDSSYHSSHGPVAGKSVQWRESEIARMDRV
jgi:hypothetical protein